MQLIQFKPNEPQELTLGSDIQPAVLPHNAGALYSLADGRILHLGERPAQALADLGLAAGESFRICLHQKSGELPCWSAWLSPETERKRAVAETSELEKQLAASLDMVNLGRKPALAATGTEGAAVLPFAMPKKASAGRKSGNGPIPYNVAFREIVALVASELKTCGEQWSDTARQDAVSTLFIAAGKAGWLGVWERGEAA